jgi:hypothetical protein
MRTFQYYHHLVVATVSLYFFDMAERKALEIQNWSVWQAANLCALLSGGAALPDNATFRPVQNADAVIILASFCLSQQGVQRDFL